MIARSAFPKLEVVRAPVRVREPREEVEESDADLVAGVRAGRLACKERLYRRHVAYVGGMAARMLRSIDLSEDVVQDSFVIAFSKMDSLREPAAFRGWLAQIAVSQVHRRLSRQRLLRFLGLDRGLDDAPLDELARDDTTAEVRSELAALDLVLQELPPRQRIAWMLRYVEGEPLEAVAEACECSLATAKRWIAAGDERVKAHVRLATREEPS